MTILLNVSIVVLVILSAFCLSADSYSPLYDAVVTREWVIDLLIITTIVRIISGFVKEDGSNSPTKYRRTHRRKIHPR